MILSADSKRSKISMGFVGLADRQKMKGVFFYTPFVLSSLHSE